MKFARVLILGITLSFGACTGLDDGVHFIEDYKSSYILVEGCSLTAHPVGGYHEMWVSPDAASNADVKDGSVLVKVQWIEDANCTPDEQDLFTVMRRTAPGAGDDATDWLWQTVGGGGDIIQTDAPTCAGCHAACGGSSICTSWEP